MKEIILDLSTASLEELLHYQNILNKEVTKRRQETKREAAQKIRELAKTYQLDVQDIVSPPTSSKRSKAILNPSKICARSSAFFKSKRVFLSTTSTWKSI